MQWSQHLLKDGPLHVGAPQISLLKVTTGQITVLPGGRGEGGRKEEREGHVKSTVFKERNAAKETDYTA